MTQALTDVAQPTGSDGTDIRPFRFKASDADLNDLRIVAFSQTDFTEDLKKITVPVLVMHGDDDQIVPYADSAPLSAKLLRNSTLKTYKGFPHGMPTTEANTINADLLPSRKPESEPALEGSGGDK